MYEENGELRLMVTGHRKLSDQILQRFAIWTEAEIQKLKKDYPRITAVSGMALGVDQIFAAIVIAEHIPLIAAIPFSEQDGWRRIKLPNSNYVSYKPVHRRCWPKRCRDDYRAMLERASRKIYVDCEPRYTVNGTRPGAYHPAKMQMRNKWMVDWVAESRSGLCITYFDGRPGGTANCLQLVKAVDIPIVYFPVGARLNHEGYDTGIVRRLVREATRSRSSSDDSSSEESAVNRRQQRYRSFNEDDIPF